jgi:hypothetical protein
MIQYAVFGAAIVGGLALFGWISKRWTYTPDYT